MKKFLAPLVALPLVVAGCSSAEEPQTNTYTVNNCDMNFKFSQPPRRVVLQDVTPVLTLDELGVLDTVVAKAGYFPDEYFDKEMDKKIDAVETLSDRLDSTGHLQISKEAIVAQRPDLVIGYSDAYSPENVTDTPVVIDPGYCGKVKNATWEHVNDEIDLYANIFQKPAEGEKLKKKVAEQVKTLDSSVGQNRTVAVLYPGVEGGTLYAYGADSMTNPMVKSLGLKNVFAEVPDRVFEISAEQLVAKQPDVILILNSGEERVIESVENLPGADTIPAVKHGTILPMLIAFAEPPSPMAVTGAKMLEEFLRKNPQP